LSKAQQSERSDISVLTTAEIEYLRGQQLGRLATVNAGGEPHVVPVSFRYNPDLDTIDIGGHNIGKSKKFHDAAKTGRTTFVVDDVLPPWRVRGVEVRGRAEVFSEGGEELNSAFDAELIRIVPSHIVGWGIDTDPYRPNSRAVG
jgi:pyridoxamine 5'-phosphate oxidase family protein